MIPEKLHVRSVFSVHCANSCWDRGCLRDTKWAQKEKMIHEAHWVGDYVGEAVCTMEPTHTADPPLSTSLGIDVALRKSTVSCERTNKSNLTPTSLCPKVCQVVSILSVQQVFIFICTIIYVLRAHRY